MSVIPHHDTAMFEMIERNSLLEITKHVLSSIIYLIDGAEESFEVCEIADW